MEKELEEYCHDVADKRKDIEDLILRRELQDAWSAHDRQCTAYGDGLTPAMRQTKCAIQQLEQRLLNQIGGECCEDCVLCMLDAHVSKKMRGEGLQESPLGHGIPPMEELQALKQASKAQLQQGVAVLNRIQWSMGAVWVQTFVCINLDRTPDDFFYDYDSGNTATKELHRQLIYNCHHQCHRGSGYTYYTSGLSA